MPTYKSWQIGAEEQRAPRASLPAKGMRKSVGAPWQDGLLLVIAQLCAARRNAAPWGCSGVPAQLVYSALAGPMLTGPGIQWAVSVPKTCRSQCAIQVVKTKSPLAHFGALPCCQACAARHSPVTEGEGNYSYAPPPHYCYGGCC